MTEPENPNPEVWWKNRRRMGWYGVIGASFSGLLFLIVTGTGLLETETASAVRPVIQTSIWAHLTLAVIYQGGASLVDAVARLRNGN